MAYQHGIYIEEVSTALQPLVQVESPIVVIGTASKGPINEATLVYSMKEFATTFGYVGDFETYSLEEAAYVCFSLYNVAPLVVINVYDPSVHVTRTQTGTDADTGEAIYTTTPDPTKVKAEDIVGGFNGETNKASGLECIAEVYPKLGVVPSVIISPHWSLNKKVAAGMIAKCKKVSSCFRSVCIVDISSYDAKNYTAVADVKSANNLSSEDCICCYPQVSLGGQKMWLSTHTAALMMQIDSGNDSIPYESPSNKRLQVDSVVAYNGRPVYYTQEQANYLNGIGVVTAFRFGGSLRLWGNRTSIYPTTADPKDSFIPVRRVFSWLGNQLILSFFSRIDNPLNKRLIESVTDSAGVYLNGLVARGVLLAAQILFLEEENPVTDLADGLIRFHLQVTPAVPARSITFVLEFDTNALSNLFA